MMTADILYKIPNDLRKLKQWALFDKSGIINASSLLPFDNEFSIVELENFEFCFSKLKQQKALGIAFYVTPKNSITVIEMKYSDDYDISIKYAEIINKVGSYTEVNQDGSSVIICRASIKHNLSIKNISLSNQNFIKLSGNQCNQVNDIIEAQGYTDQIFSELIGKEFNKLEENHKLDLNIEIPITKSNEEILMELQYEDKNDHFQNLWFGNFGKKISKQEAQLQLINLISAKTQNKAQIQEIFSESPFSKEFSENTALLIESIKEPQIHEQEPIEFDENFKSDFEYPPGRISELIEFIYNKSPRQVPEISTLSAFGYMSAFAGRCFNYLDFGLNTNNLIIANTTVGKEIMTTGFDMILMKFYRHFGMDLMKFKNSSDIASGPALIKTLGSCKSSLSILSEFGSTLSRFSQKNVFGPDQSLLKIFLELYSKSSRNSFFGGLTYSDTKLNVPIVKSPSYSILAESNPEFLYANLNDRMITNGFLNRFVILEYKGDIKYLNENHSNYQMSERLENFFKEFLGECIKMNAQDAVVDVLADKKSAELSTYLSRFYTDLGNKKTNVEIHRHLYGRNHIKIMKMAALMAVMDNPSAPVLNEKQILWSQKVVDIGCNNLLRKFELGEIGSENDETLMNNKILQCLKEYNRKKYDEVKSYGVQKLVKEARYCPYIYISRRNTSIGCFKNHRLGATNAIKNTLKNLIELNEIEEIGFKELGKLGVKGQFYKLVRKEQEYI